MQPRLKLLADMVPKGCRLADVGTDHGYVPVYLRQKGKIVCAIASDIVEGPLQHARETAAEYGVEGIDFRLCSGLEGVAPHEVDTVLIAGMGGETIQSILTAAPWTREGAHLLLLQPMTKVEYLRKWIADNEYTFTEERLVFDKEHLYPVFAVRGGWMPPLTPSQQYGGVLLEGEPLYAAYLDERIGKLQRAIQGLLASRTEENAVKVNTLTDICRALQERRELL